jgi:two-component system sensor histidine kinase YesM
MVFIRNYIEINKIRYQNQIFFSQKIPEYLENEIIPTLSIATFVENSVKHGFIQNENLEINVTVDLIQVNSQNCLSVEISDNGKGFTQEQLKDFNDSEILTLDDSHIGIANVVKRLHYLYRDSAAIKFENNIGSTVKMQIPIKSC